MKMKKVKKIAIVRMVNVILKKIKLKRFSKIKLKCKVNNYRLLIVSAIPRLVT